GVLLPEATRVVDDDLGEPARPSGRVHVVVGYEVAVAAVESAGVGRRRWLVLRRSACRDAHHRDRSDQPYLDGAPGHHISDDNVFASSVCAIWQGSVDESPRICTHQLATPGSVAAVAEHAVPVTER